MLSASPLLPLPHCRGDCGTVVCLVAGGRVCVLPAGQGTTYRDPASILAFDRDHLDDPGYGRFILWGRNHANRLGRNRIDHDLSIGLTLLWSISGYRSC